MFCAYVVYTSATAETYEQCIAGNRTEDGIDCSLYETRPGPDTQMVFFFSLLGIVSLAFTVHLIWKEMKRREAAIHLEIKTRQLRNVTPTPWWAFWRIVHLIWKDRQHRKRTPTPK